MLHTCSFASWATHPVHSLGRKKNHTFHSRQTVSDSLESFFQMLPIRRLGVFAAWKASVNLALYLSLVLPGSPWQHPWPHTLVFTNLPSGQPWMVRLIHKVLRLIHKRPGIKLWAVVSNGTWPACSGRYECIPKTRIRFDSSHMYCTLLSETSYSFIVWSSLKRRHSSFSPAR
jgi:hypothetical protein